MQNDITTNQFYFCQKKLIKFYFKKLKKKIFQAQQCTRK